MNFCSIDEAWGQKKLEGDNSSIGSDDSSRINRINKVNTHKNESKQSDSSSECLSSSSIESFDIIPRKNKNNKYYKNGEIKESFHSAKLDPAKLKHKKSRSIKDTISSLATDSIDTISDSSLIETFTESIKDKSKCNKLVKHIMKCKKCRDKLRKKFRPPLVRKLNLLFDDNKDLCVLILIAFAILIFFKIIFSMCD